MSVNESFELGNTETETHDIFFNRFIVKFFFADESNQKILKRSTYS